MCIDVQAVVVAEPLLFSGGGVDVRDSPMHARSSRPAQRRLSAESPTTATRRTRRGRHRVGGRLGDGGVGDVRQLILDDLRHPPQPAWPPGFRTCVWITGVGDRKESGSSPVPVRHLGLRRHRRVELGDPTTRRSNRPVSPRPRLGPRLLGGCTHASAPPQPGDSSPGTPPPILQVTTSSPRSIDSHPNTLLHHSENLPDHPTSRNGPPMQYIEDAQWASEATPNLVLQQVAEHGLALIRPDRSSLDQFDELTERIMRPMVHHATNTNERDSVDSSGSISTVNKGQDAIPLHREASYAPGSPDYLAFYCDTPADNYGETLVCDGVNLLLSLPEPVQRYLENARMVWSWEAPPSRWSATFGTTDIKTAESRLATLQKSLPDYESLEAHFDGDTLVGRFHTCPVIPSKGSKETGFCNSLPIYYLRQKSEYFARDLFRVTLESGGPFPSDVLDTVIAHSNAITNAIQWQPGDIAIVDNSRYMHGRNHFQDPSRRILIRMGFSKV